MPSLEILLFLTDFILESAIRRSTTPLSENGILHHHSPNIQKKHFFKRPTVPHLPPKLWQ
jgi:hypothetical protein